MNVFKTKSCNKITEDPSRFQGKGINFKGKFIGERVVNEARGIQIFSDAMREAKAAVKVSGGHKPRIILNVSMEGLKIKDERDLIILYTFPIEKISFLARDQNDYRAFGFIFSDANGKSNFFGIKTAVSSEHAYLCISELFQVAADVKKKNQEDDISKEIEEVEEVDDLIIF